MPAALWGSVIHPRNSDFLQRVLFSEVKMMISKSKITDNNSDDDGMHSALIMTMIILVNAFMRLALKHQNQYRDVDVLNPECQCTVIDRQEGYNFFCS